MEKQLLKADEVAEILGLHPQTVYRFRESGKLKAVRIGRRGIRFHRSEIERFAKVGVKR